MNFGFTEEQEMLRVEVRKFLDVNASIEEVRRIMESPAGFERKLWNEMAQLGWLGLLIPENLGGAGLGWVDLTVLLEECGRSLFPSPLVGSTLATIALLENGTPAQKECWLPSIADGSALFALALPECDGLLGDEGFRIRADQESDGWIFRGETQFVPDAASATHYVVAFRSGVECGDIGLAVVERTAQGLTVEDTPCIDATKRFGCLRFDGVHVSADRVLTGSQQAGWIAVAGLLEHAAAAVTAEAIGAAEGAHALIVRYAKERVQFGSVIGRYQGDRKSVV